MLTQRQQEAISDYLDFTRIYPQLFSPRALRRIISDRTSLEQYAEEHGVVLGVAAETPHAYFIVDLVETNRTDGTKVQYPYLRLIYRKQLEGAVNTVVLGVIANAELGAIDSIVMLRQERHATGLFHLELPRGFGEVNLSGEQNALKELREETGYLGERAKILGATYTDSGVMDAMVAFYYVPIVGKLEAMPEVGEAIDEIQIISIAELWEKIRSGEVTDSFTVQALAFLHDQAQLHS
ncbi:MAG: NUDIX hydrolase [Pyrinomonadaceae bacterium]|nr:NUDIX hydrolase [Pyrinomonadaceae bacterium]